MFELAIAAGGTTGCAIAERAELWYFLGARDVEVTSPASRRAVAAGDMMYVPAGAAREVSAARRRCTPSSSWSRAGARAPRARGRCRRRELTSVKTGVAGPIRLPAAAARKTYGRRRRSLFAEPSTIKDRTLAASILDAAGGRRRSPSTCTPSETELLYVLAGAGTMTVAGRRRSPSTPTSVVQIPPNTQARVHRHRRRPRGPDLHARRPRAAVQGTHDAVTEPSTSASSPATCAPPRA